MYGPAALQQLAAQIGLMVGGAVHADACIQQWLFYGCRW